MTQRRRDEPLEGLELPPYSPRATNVSQENLISPGMKKEQTPEDTTRSVDDANDINSRLSAYWIPGFWARFPFVGFAAVLAYLGAAAGVVAVLLSSDGEITDTWGWGHAPNTYLSILSIVMNMLLSFAFAQGLTLSYWRKLLKGSTIAGLHYHWNAGQSIFGAFEGVFRGFGLLNGLAFIAWICSSARSPVNQAAAGIDSNVVFPTNGTMHLELAQKLPEGYTGQTTYSRAAMSETSALTRNFSTIMRDYSNRRTLKLEHSYCGDMCNATLNVFGFDANCTTHVGEALSGDLDPGASYTLFSTDVAIWGDDDYMSLYTGYTGGLNVTSYYKSNDTGTPKQHTRMCLLQPSIMALPVTFSNSTVSLYGSMTTDRQVEKLEYQGPSSRNPRDTTIGGFQLAMSTLFKSSATYEFGGAVSSIRFEGNTVNQYVDSSSAADFTSPDDVNWNDPTDDILDAVREVAFRTSLYATTDSSMNTTARNALDPSQDVYYVGDTLNTVYSTDIIKMIIGAALAVLGLLGALPLYYGWWELGRDVTMSPVEIAKAFDARLLAETNEHDAKGLVRAGKKMRIKYALGMDNKAPA
ncbi:uncharacterized protein J3D65DRAFT_146901 [Phyllosticta citribraziliensis]|uniref:Uncharacterized protein n=1 Tax=Phyllosticta citribraziliensis TaxID=989973 RepID=A0ABR1L4H5_9PEZI